MTVQAGAAGAPGVVFREWLNPAGVVASQAVGTPFQGMRDPGQGCSSQFFCPMAG